MSWRATITLVLALGARAMAATCDDPFGAPDGVLPLHLRLTHAAWDALRLEKNPGLSCDAQYTWHQVDFRCGDDGPWLPIGVRHKRGDQRGVDAPQKPPLKLDFNRYLDGQRWPAALGALGFRKLSLNNGQANLPGGVLPALAAEAVAWRLMQREAPFSSRTTFAQLWLHFTDEPARVEYRGLYLLLEDLDRTALRRRHGHACGALLKSTVVWCREEPDFDDGPPNAARAAYDAWYEGRATDASEALELDDLLRQEALRDVLGNALDAPLGERYNNYSRWEPREGRARFYPWDLDWLFAVYPLEIAPDTPLDGTCSPLGEKTRCAKALRPRYLQTMCELTQGTLSPEAVLAEWSAVDALARPLVREESDAVWAGEDPLSPTLRGSYQDVHLRMQDWIPRRIESVRAQLARAGIECPATCADGAERGCGVGGCGGVSRCVAGAWTSCEVSRAEERCNGADDDCDGLVDEGCDLPKEPCVKATPEPRRNLSSCACSAGVDAAWLGLAALTWRRRRR